MECQVCVPMRVLARGALFDLPAAALRFRSKDTEEQERDAIRQGEQSLQQRQRGWVGPMQVLTDEDQWPLSG